MTGGSCIYTGTVVHRRLKPTAHRLRYRVFSLLLDLDEVAELDRRLRFFSLNRFNLFGFWEKDHALGDGAPPRRHVERHLQAAGIDLDGGPIRLLCYPRVLGYVFNPLSVYFCHHRDGTLRAILYEVSNTFGERHGYLIPVEPEEEGGVVRQRCGKRLYVSPFMEMAQTYDFRILPPDADGVTVAIRQTDAEGPILNAAFVGRAEALTDGTLLRLFVSQPLMTLKVIGGIHWEALKLWLKGVPLVDRPAPPEHPVTLVERA